MTSNNILKEKLKYQFSILTLEAEDRSFWCTECPHYSEYARCDRDCESAKWEWLRNEIKKL